MEVVCCWCGRSADVPDGGWEGVPGWGCLYGTLAVCSVGCAEAFAGKWAYGLKAGDLEFPRGSQGWKGVGDGWGD